MTDVEFNDEVSGLLDEAEAFIGAVISVKYWTPEQLAELNQRLGECADAMDQLLQVDYVN